MLAPRTSLAQSEPLTGHSYSAYEQESIDQATEVLKTSVDPEPEGKIVEAIDVIALEVIEKRDPAPAALNLLHATSRRRVIEREVLLEIGAPYLGASCDESARNLRALSQLSLVICTATRGKSPGHVRVLVITKDVWSLRLGWDISFIGGRLESLQLVPTERNLAGSHHTLYGQYTYQPDSQTFGIGYAIPRLDGRRLSLNASVAASVNRDGHVEGSSGSLGVAQPLYSARTEWSWAMGTSWSDGIARLYRNGRLAVDQNGVHWAYRSRRITEGANITRSFGWAMKHDVTAGVEMNIREYQPPVDRTASAAAIAAFTRTNLPTSDTRVGPFLQYRAYTSNFLRVLDFETLGLQEDFRLGHDVWLRVYPIASELGSSRSFLGTYAGIQYTVPFGDGLGRIAIENSLEAEAKRISDAYWSADLRLVTPRLGIGRLIFDAGVLDRYRNYMNRLSYLGGDGRLRGFPSSAFYGRNLVVYNLEFRTRPVEVLSCQLGGAVFYDVGDAPDDLAHLRMRQSTGFGFRILFPQLDRVVFRGDVGFPLGDRALAGTPNAFAPYTVAVSFEQAFSVPGVGGRIGSAPAAGWLGQ